MKNTWSSPDRQRLFLQWRCKSFGTPWSQEEREEIMKSWNRREQTIAKLRKEKPAKHSFEENVEKKLEKEIIEEKLATIAKVMASDGTEKTTEPQKDITLVVNAVEEITLTLEEAQNLYLKKFGEKAHHMKKLETLLKELV